MSSVVPEEMRGVAGYLSRLSPGLGSIKGR